MASRIVADRIARSTVVCVAIAGIWSGSAMAADGLRSPSARTLQAGSVRLSADSTTQGQMSTEVSYAVTDSLELGAVTPFGSPLLTDMRLSAKLRLLAETPWTPQVAAGFRYDGWFVSAVKRLGSTGIDAYGGVGLSSLSRGFVGVSKENRLDTHLPISVDTIVSAEIIGDKVNIGAGLRLGRGLWAGLRLDGMTRPILGVQFDLLGGSLLNPKLAGVRSEDDRG